MRRATVVWLTRKSLAALSVLPFSATLRKYLRSFQSNIAPPLRSPERARILQ